MTTEIDKIKKLLNTDDAHMIAAAFLCEINTGFDIEDICETCEEVESMYGPDRDFTFFGGDDEVDIVTENNRRNYLQAMYKESAEMNLTEDLLPYFDMDQFIEDKLHEPVLNESSVEIDGQKYYGYYY